MGADPILAALYGVDARRELLDQRGERFVVRRERPEAVGIDESSDARVEVVGRERRLLAGVGREARIVGERGAEAA